MANGIKDNQVARLGDVKRVVQEATDTILAGIDKLFQNVATKDDLFNVESGITKRLDKIESEMSFIKDDIQGIKADLSNTVNRREFEALKEQVTSN